MKMLFFLTLVLSSISICCALPPAEITLNGRATPFYGNTANSSQQTVIDIMRKAKLAEQMADVIQSGVRLRKDIIVGIESCGEPNAFFDPKRHAIVICSEFIELTVKAMYADDRLSSTLSKPQLNTWMFGVIWSVYFHELAHAIISTNDVPITGREEDVADQFLIWYAVNYLNLKKQPIVGPTIWYYKVSANMQNISTLDQTALREILSDEHSMDEVRSYNFACWVFGANPQLGIQAVQYVKLPLERAKGCGLEYARLDTGIRAQFNKSLKANPN